MSSLRLLNVLDVARSLGPQPANATSEQVKVWLQEEYLRKSGGGFNYNPAINASYDLFRGVGSEDQAVLHCLATGNPKGRRQNADAIKHVAPYALANVSRCYRIPFTAVAVGRAKDTTIYIAIKAPLVRVRGSDVFVVMPGFRMSHRPGEMEINLACSIALATFGRDDFAEADFEYLYAGPGASGAREFRAIKGRDRTIFDRDTIDGLLQIYVQGVALAADEGAVMREPVLAGYRIIDPSEPLMSF